MFALSNGHISGRANLGERAPHSLPGSYLNGVHEQRPLPYAEGGYGYPEAAQVMINVTNGKLIRLPVGDEPFDVRYGELRGHERVLNLRAVVLSRRADWSSPAECTIRVTSTRLVSLVQRSVAAIDYQVEAVDRPVRLIVQSELAANKPLPEAGGAPHRAQRADDGGGHGPPGRRSVLHPGAGRELRRPGPGDGHRIAGARTAAAPGQARHLRLVRDAVPACGTRPADAALTAARQASLEGLLAEQRAYLDDFWTQADVEVDGDIGIQQAVRFAPFHVLQAGARAEGRTVPAKGLTGPGSDGHAFWDTQTFVLPVLTYTTPAAAAHAPAWRHATLLMALDRAAQLDLQGAAFPWRTITGAECSSYWAAGTAVFPVGADIAEAVTTT